MEHNLNQIKVYSIVATCIIVGYFVGIFMAEKLVSANLTVIHKEQAK